MRGLTLFKPLVSSYRKAPVSVGQIRQWHESSGYSKADTDEFVFTMTMTFLPPSLIIMAIRIYQAICEDNSDSENQKAISSGTTSSNK